MSESAIITLLLTSYAVWALMFGAPRLLSWVFYFKENELIEKIKEEIASGNAVARYYRSGWHACCTRCDFSFSGGSFSTTLDPTVGVTGVSETILWKVGGSDGLSNSLIGRRLHDWTQSYKPALTERKKKECR